MHDFIQYFSSNPTALYLAVGLFSLCVGSFLNVVILRTPKIMEQEWRNDCQLLLNPEQPIIDDSKLSLSSPASSCPQCNAAIRWYQNIPIISWLALRGKCAQCQTPISVRYPLIEGLTVICSLMVVMVYGATLAMLCGLILTWALIALTFIDFDTQLLPDRMTLTLAGAGLAVNSYSVFTTPTLAIWGYVIGFLCLWVVYYLFKLITGKEGMGYGDFKLLAALGAWMGPFLLPLIILFSSFFGAILGMILLKVRKENQPFAFGPFIAIAGWVAFLWGTQIMKVYLGN